MEKSTLAISTETRYLKNIFDNSDDDGCGYFRFGTDTILNQNILVMIKYSVLALRLRSYEAFKFIYFESNANNLISTNVYCDCQNEEELEQFVRKFGINVFDGTDSNVDIYLYHKNDVYSCTIVSPTTNNKEYSCTNLLYIQKIKDVVLMIFELLQMNMLM